MKQLFLTFAAALLLLPATLWADTAKKKIKSVEITITPLLQEWTWRKLKNSP